MGPPARDLRAVGAADPRGLVDALGDRGRDEQDPARADGRGEHVPLPGPHREARDDARQRQPGPGGARHRRRLVRAGARRVRDRGVGLRRRRAARPPRRVRRDHAPAARRRAVQPRGHATTSSTTRSASRGRSRPTCRSSSAARARRRRSGRPPATRDAWNTAGHRRRGSRAASTSSAGHCADVGRDFDEIELTISFPIVIRDDAAAAEAAYAETARRRTGRTRSTSPTLLGGPQLVADGLAPFADMGFTTVIVRLPARTTSRRSTGCPR